MSKFSDFLNPVSAVEERDVYVSDRFVRRDEKGEIMTDDDGKPVLRPFRIRSITQEENTALVKAATTVYRDKTGQKVSDFDRIKYSQMMVVAGTIDPDFTSKEICDGLGVVSPNLAPGKMLYAGEYQKLADAIADASGINDDLEEAAKN